MLDSGEAVFSGLAWRKDADDLAVLRSKTEPLREGPTQIVLAWQGLEQGAGVRRTLDPVPAILPADQRIVSARRPEWSKDGRIIFVGIAALGRETGQREDRR